MSLRRRAVSCAKSIQREILNAFANQTPPVRVRIGVHTGDALHEADEFFGTTVHYAARVAGTALGGEILVSSVVRDLVAGGLDVTFIDEREVQLKGIEGLHRLSPWISPERCVRPSSSGDIPSQVAVARGNEECPACGDT